MQKNNYNYAVFVLSHGRPNNIKTIKTLRNSGYTGRVYVIIDDEDKTQQEYLKNYGSDVIVFNKTKVASTCEKMDNFNIKKVILYARNACFEIARSIGLDYFFEYDDDYVSILHRWVDDNDILHSQPVRNLDDVFIAMIQALNETQFDTIAFTQGGDFIGSSKSYEKNSYKRKAMNTFLFKVHTKPTEGVKFIGTFNEDVNLYLNEGKKGRLFAQIADIMITQLQTQSNAGGITETYKNFGTYVKSFYSVIVHPSACKISTLGPTNSRVHHHITWKNAVPKILSPELKK